MKNYLKLNEKIIPLSDEQVQKIKQSFDIKTLKLADISVGDTFKVGEYEFIVLDRIGVEGTIVVLNGLINDSVAFSDSGTNNYDGSIPDKLCNEFADKLTSLLDAENVYLREVDLTTDDGLKNFGKIERKVSLMTTNERRKYVDILDKHPLKKWEWLATAYSAPPHDSDNWVKCVAPSGYFVYGVSYDGHFGVRPYCILNSNIFVSKGA